MKAPKLTEAQRKALALLQEAQDNRFIGIRGTIATSTRRKLRALGYCDDGVNFITPAGRAALKEDAYADEYAPVTVDRCPACGKPCHATEGNQDGYHPECMPKGGA